MTEPDRFTGERLWIQRHQRREGPPVVYTVMFNNAARPFTNKKELLNWVKCPKGTTTGDRLIAWLDSFNDE